MIDLERALNDQRDLERLLQPHDLSSSAEKFARNDGYGHARILKEYAGYDPTLPVEAVIPHGVYLDAERLFTEERDAAVPAVLNYPQFRDATWGQMSDKVVIPSASPFLYALALYRASFPDAPPAQGTIFFLAHSTETTHLTARHDSLIREFNALEDEAQPVTVCMHVADYRKGLHRPFAEAGFKIVSAGDPWDQEFLNRWLHLVSSHALTASNDVGGCAFYSVAAGKPFRLIGERPVFTVDPTVHYITRNLGVGFHLSTSDQVRETDAHIYHVFSDETGDGSARQELTDYLLGAQNFKSPSELLGDLEYAADLAESR